MNSTLLDLIRFKCLRTTAQIRGAVGRLKTEKPGIKLQIQFGEEVPFSKPIWIIVRTRVPASTQPAES